MMNRIGLYAAAMLAVLGVAATGAARAEGPDLIAVRQAAFDMNNASWQFIRSVVASKGDVKPLEVPAKAIARWATVIPSMFPPGTEKGGDTKALPEIWSDKAGFEKAAMALNTASLKLADAAKAGDAEAVATDMKAVGESCGGCHRTFRAK